MAKSLQVDQLFRKLLSKLPAELQFKVVGYIEPVDVDELNDIFCCFDRLSPSCLTEFKELTDLALPFGSEQPELTCCSSSHRHMREYLYQLKTYWRGKSRSVDNGHLLTEDNLSSDIDSLLDDVLIFVKYMLMEDFPMDDKEIWMFKRAWLGIMLDKAIFIPRSKLEEALARSEPGGSRRILPTDFNDERYYKDGKILNNLSDSNPGIFLPWHVVEDIVRSVKGKDAGGLVIPFTDLKAALDEASKENFQNHVMYKSKYSPKDLW